MSGIFSQLGCVKEIGVNATITAITAVAGFPNTGTVAATAHGYRAGDVVTQAGFTPSGWNGTFSIMSVTANTYTISTGATVVATSTVQGTITNVTKFGGGGTPTRFWEIPPGGETFKYDRGRVQSLAVTANRYARRSDRFMPYSRGGVGNLKLEVLSKGFAYWLSLLAGTVVQTGPTDSAYTYTTTPSSTLGQTACIQVGRPQSVSNVVQPFTYLGAKIQAWSLDNTIDGILMLMMTFSFQNEVVNVALASPSYPASSELLTFVGGTITLGGIQLATVKTVQVASTQGLSPVTDRRFINNSATPAEPLQIALRTYTWRADVEFTDMTAYNRYVNATAAGTMATLNATWNAPTLIGVSTYPSLVVTAPNARHDGDTPNVNGHAVIVHSLRGELLNTNATADDAVTIAYTTLDSAA